MAAILENLKYDPNGTSTNNLAEDWSSEGKFGIPRFGGQPSALQEYAFRVRSRMIRESKMDESEVKKLGPLGLRLVEGLRGDALKLAQQLKMDDLAKPGAPEQRLKLFTENLKPRKAQEARELFAAGSKDGGILARQQNEPMSSYVMRRRAWWSALQDLEEDMRVSETILSEQLLMNAGITEDQRLTVRTMLQGNMSFNRVAEELLAQHPRIHDRERRQKGKGHGKGFSKPWRRPFNPVNKSYWGEGHGEDGEDDWEVQSQSLTGYTAECEDYEAEELYDAQSYAAFEGDSVNEYEYFLENHMALLAEGGFDIDNDEACALAAESIQLEYEAYNVRSQAKGKGHGGFGSARHFEVSGQLSLQERKARLQLLKSKTECRRCGQRGHWSGDPQCPKGSRRQDGSTGGKSSSSKSSSGGRSHSDGKKGGTKPGQNPKPRVVYFALGESGATGDGHALMALRSDADPGKEEQRSARGVCIPPPECLGPATPTSRTLPSSFQRRGASLTMSMAFARSPLVGSPGEVGALTSRPRGLAPKSAPRGSRAPSLDYQIVPMQQPPSDLLDLQAGGMSQGEMPSAMTAEEELGERLVQHWNQQHGGVHFDVNLPPLPELHPLQSQQEMMMAQQHVQQALATLAAMEVDDGEFRHKEVAGQVHHVEGPVAQPLAVPPLPVPSAQQHVAPTGDGCPHSRTTRKGSNAYIEMVTCLDCHQVISKVKKSDLALPSTAASVPQRAAGGGTGNPACKCLNVTWRGSNGYQWKKTCLDCGQVRIGNQATRTTSTTSDGGSSSQQPHAPQLPHQHGQHNMSQVQEILRSSLMVASVKAAERPMQCLEMSEIHRILDVVAQTIPALPQTPTPYSSIPTTPAQSPQQGRTPEEQRMISEQLAGGLPEPGTAYGNARMPTPVSPGDHPKNREVMNFGKYKGKPFWYAYTDDDYLDWCLINVSDRSCRGLKKFVEYIHERNAMKQHRTYMALSDEGEERTPVESDLVAILDLGCNKT